MTTAAEYSHLRKWTPLSFEWGAEPAVTWADLRQYRFDDPFFSRTIRRWRASGSCVTEQTGLAVLRALDSAPSLDPSLIIAHPTRCGSTLLSRLIGALDGAFTVSEPPVLGRLMTHALTCPADFSHQEIIAMTVRALGRIRFGDERRYVLKLNGGMIFSLPTLRRAFPGVPIVWLQRRPAEIVASNLRSPGPWIGDKHDLIDPAERARQVMHKLTAGFLAATGFLDEKTLVLDYRDLPEAAWTLVAPRMGVTPTDDEIARMREVTRVHSKSLSANIMRDCIAFST